MEISIFLAKFYGLLLFILGGALLIRRNNFAAIIDNLLANPGLVLFAGVINLIVGLLTVISHNVWVANWAVIITILGYLMLLSGILRLTLPEFGRKWAEKIKNSNAIAYFSIAYIIIGLFLMYKGFWPH